MQTSSLTPVILYSALTEEAEALLPLLPKDSQIVDDYAAIRPNRRAILITQDQTSARSACQWVDEQSAHRQAQIFLLLPAGASRLTPQCTYSHRPTRFHQILQFLSSSKALPELPDSLKFTEIETQLLEQLYSADEPVDHDQLMANIWGITVELETHTLDTHLYRLRKKLEKTSFNIVTQDGSYQLLSSPK